MFFLVKPILEKKYPLFNTAPAYWSSLKEVQQAFRCTSYMFPYKNLCHNQNYHDEGIVMCGGGSLWISVFISVSALRHHGCDLPIQVWYLGSQEYDEDMMRFISHLDVEFVDALAVAEDYETRILKSSMCFQKFTKHATVGGYAMKSFAIINSRFERLLYLDADNTPTKNPYYLFESSHFLKYGLYFFPDKYHPDCENAFKLSKKNCEIFGVDFLGDISLDSGQILIDKSKCMNSIKQTFWWNDFSDYTYQILFGDKDTFDLGARQTKTKYYIVPKFPISGYGLQQHDHNGDLIFLHRCGAKWNLEKNIYLDRPQENLLHNFANKFIEKFKKQYKLYL